MASHAALVALALLATVAVAFVSVPREEAPGGGSAGPAGSPAWETLAKLPLSRTEASAVGVGGKLWVIGGILPPNPSGVSAVGRVDVYDPATDTWSAGPPLPIPAHHMGVVAAGTRIVATGGFVGGQMNEPQFVALASCWVLDTADAAPAWRELPALPLPRGGHAAATDGVHVWVFGGVVGAPVYQSPGALLLDASVYRAPLAGGPWTRVADLPDPRDHLAGAFADGKVFAIGGRDLTLDKNTGRVDVYDPATDAWSRAPDMPTPRGGLGAALLGGRIYVAGGESPVAAHAEVEALDVATLSWSAAPPLPAARHGVGVAALDGALYVEAGGPRPAFTYSDSNYRLRLA